MGLPWGWQERSVFVQSGKLGWGWEQKGRQGACTSHICPSLQVAPGEWQVYLDTASAANMLWDHGNNRPSPGSRMLRSSLSDMREIISGARKALYKTKHLNFHCIGVHPEATALIQFLKVSFFMFTINPWLTIKHVLAYRVLVEKDPFLSFRDTCEYHILV